MVVIGIKDFEVNFLGIVVYKGCILGMFISRYVRDQLMLIMQYVVGFNVMSVGFGIRQLSLNFYFVFYRMILGKDIYFVF